MAGDLNKAHAKTWNGKWNGMKKGMFIDKFGYINLPDAITHVAMGNTIKCALYDISYDYSISFNYSYCFLFRLCSVL
jgi:hypothetical protein